jgi:hypothetical protein
MKDSTCVDKKPVLTEPERCFYCSEMAVGRNADGLPICGIPGNHPGSDDVVTENTDIPKA